MIRLLPDQYRKLKDALQTAFDLFTLNQMLLFEVSKVLEAEAGGKDLGEILFNLIKKAQMNNWLAELIAGAAKANPTADLLKIAADLQPAISAQNVNHFNVCFVDVDLALVNRVVLRKSLEQLAGAALPGARILVVNGPPQSGKTYSKELIGYLRRALESFRLVWIDLLTFSGEVKPADVARAIVDQMGLDQNTLPPLDQEQDSRWVQTFCNRLTGQLGNKSDSWWVVMDGFTHVTLSPPVDDLVKELSSRARLTLPGLRMVLLSYPDSLPSDVEKVALRENIFPIEERDLINFFHQVYTERNKTPSAKDIAERIGEVWRAVDRKDPKLMETLGAEVAKVSKSIIDQGGPGV